MGGTPSTIVGLHGKLNTGGFLSNKFFAAPIYDFLLLKGRKTTTVLGDFVTIDGSHTFPSGFGFYQFDTDLDSEKLQSEFTKAYSTGHKMKVEFTIAGNEKEIAEFAAYAPTEKFICLTNEAHLPGRTLQFGEDGLECQLNFKHENGTNSEGKKMWTVEMTVVQHSMLYYEGTITQV